MENLSSKSLRPSLFFLSLIIFLTAPLLISASQQLPPATVKPQLESSSKTTTLKFAPHQLIIKYKADVQPTTLETQAATQTRSLFSGLTNNSPTSQYQQIQSLAQDIENVSLPDFQLAVITLDENTSLKTAKDQLEKNPLVDSVSLNFYFTTQATLNTNDPYVKHQWGHDNSGQVIDLIDNRPTANPQISLQLTEAWKESQGKDVVVAVIDTGVDFSHEDLKHAQWNGKKKDGSPCTWQNQAVDCSKGGYAFYDSGQTENNSAPPHHPKNSHGTSVAGVIAAQANNAVGIAGVSPQVQIMSINVSSSMDAGENETFALIDIIKALTFARENGADMINFSLGSDYSFADLSREAGFEINCDNFFEYIADVYQAFADFTGPTIVAAGNNNRSLNSDNQMQVAFPAQFNQTYCGWQALDQIFTVGATTITDQKTHPSNYGPHLNLYAPGENILTTTSDTDKTFLAHYQLTNTITDQIAGIVPEGWKNTSGASPFIGRALCQGRNDEFCNTLSSKSYPLLAPQNVTQMASIDSPQVDLPAGHNYQVSTVLACEIPNDVDDAQLQIRLTSQGNTYALSNLPATLSRQTLQDAVDASSPYVSKTGDVYIAHGLANLANLSDSVITEYVWSPGSILGGQLGCVILSYDVYTVENISSNSPYDLVSGTSIAAPHVTGVAALLKSLRPQATTAQIKTALLEGAQNISINTDAGSEQVKRLRAAQSIAALKQVYPDPVSPTPTPKPDLSSPSSSRGGVSTECKDSAPSAPYLFQINAIDRQAALFFTPTPDQNTGYVVAFGLEEGSLDYGYSFANGDPHGVNIALIQDLAPNTKYFYQMRGHNGCMPGSWSNSLAAQTSSRANRVRVHYANSDQVKIYQKK